MTRPVVCAALLAAAAVRHSSVRAQARDAAPVLAAAREALGGERTLAGVKSFIATGRTRQLRGDNLVPIEFEIARELPDKYVRRDEFPAQDAPPAVNGFRGEDAIGPSKTTREEFARLMLGAFVATPAAFPLTFTYAAEAEAPEGKADVLAVAGPANFAARFVVQRETHMPVMLMWQAPAGGRAAAPAPVEHRLYDADYSQVIRDITLSIGVNASSAPPYTMLTGEDNNNDGIFDDRPAGVGRDTLRASSQVTLNMFAATTSRSATRQSRCRQASASSAAARRRRSGASILGRRATVCSSSCRRRT